MPVGKTSSRSSARRRRKRRGDDRWAMRLGRIGSTELSLSYVVFLSATIVAAIVLALWLRPENSDLPRAALLGVGFWVAGWLVQTATHLGAARLMGLQTRRLNVGLIGVESAPRPWPATNSLLVSLCTIVSLLLLGALFRLIEGGFQMPSLALPTSELWRAPSLGLTSHDSLWQSGAWLCWAQCLFQMFPLPRTMGRQSLAALTGICGRDLDLAVQTSILRRCLSAMALLTVLLAVVLTTAQDELPVASWLLLAMLGTLLWISAQAGDLTAILAGFQTQPDQPCAEPDSSGNRRRRPSGILSSITRVLRSPRDRRRLRMALERERGEAIEARRLDEILRRVHSDGIDSLSREDRAILDRVSRKLRDQRRSDSDQANPAS